METSLRMDICDLWADVHGPHANDWIWSDSHIAAFYGNTEQTVRKRRCEGTLALPYLKRGKRCMYKPADAAKDLASRVQPAPKLKSYAHRKNLATADTA